MVRIRLTADWRSDGAGATPAGRGRSAALDAVPGVLTLEVDGVDLTGGRAEGPVLPVLESLLRGVAHLLSGGRRAAVPFREGEVLLLLARRGQEALLSLALLGRPARLAVSQVAVDLPALAAAALEASAGLCADLAGAGRQAAPALRRLRAAAGQVARPRPGDAAWSPPAPEAPPAAPGDAPLRLELRLDEAGEVLSLREGEPADLASLLATGRLRLLARAEDGGERAILDAAGVPVLALRDLVAGGEEAARALRRGDARVSLPVGGLVHVGGRPPTDLLLDLVRGTASAGGGPTVPASALDLATAALAAVEDLARLAAHHAPAHRENPALEHLLAEAIAARDHLVELSTGDQRHGKLPEPPRERAASVLQTPLGPGRLHRVALRRTAEAHVGPPVGPGLVAAGRAAVALGEEAVLCLVPAEGRTAWRGPGADQAFLAGGLLLLRRGEALEAVEPASGQPRWRASLPGERPTAAAATGSEGGLVILSEAGAVTALRSRDGAVAWRRELPGASGLRLAAFGPLAVLATDAGVLHGLGPGGGLAWRVRGPGPALAAPLLVGGLVATLHGAGAGAALLFLEPASGERRGEVALDVRPAGAPVRFAGGLALGGLAGGEAVLIHVAPGRGRRWETGVPLASAPLLAAAGGRLAAAGTDGAVVMVDAAGRTGWALPAAGDGGAIPCLARGVVVAARDGVALLDGATGRLLAHAAGHAPSRLLAGPDLGIAALDAGGTLLGLAAGGHLSVVG